MMKDVAVRPLSPFRVRLRPKLKLNLSRSMPNKMQGPSSAILQHKDGHMKEYVDEFSNLLLGIPNMAPEDALFTFLNGL